MISQRARFFFFLVFALGAVAAIWIYLNRPVKNDLVTYAPADSLAFIEINDFANLTSEVTETQAWKSLAVPIGAPVSLTPNKWLTWLARWTGIGTADTIVFARSQVAIVFSGAEAMQAGSTLTIKPLVTFVVETHTSQRRMRAAVESRIKQLAHAITENPVYVRKQISGIDLEEWQSQDGSHQIVFAFVGTAVIVSNHEVSVLRSIQTHNGGPSLNSAPDLGDLRQQLDAASVGLFGFVSQSGVKSLLQAFALNEGARSDSVDLSGSPADAVSTARIFSDAIGSLVKSIGWRASFADGMIEDRFSIILAEGVAEKMRSSAVPGEGSNLSKLSFVPREAQSLSLYNFRDTSSFWTDLNAVVSSHTDAIASLAARLMLRNLLKPYGIEDPDTFARAIGGRLMTIRLEERGPSVLIVESFDRSAIQKTVAQRLGPNPRNEKLDTADISISSDGHWAAAFIDNYFLIGRAEAVRRCLHAHSQSQSLTEVDSFRKSQRLVDVSLPITALRFSDDQHDAISFVEVFSRHDRPAFATNAPAIEEAVKDLPYAVSVTLLKGSNIEWTARSSFGIAGKLVERFVPESSR